MSKNKKGNGHHHLTLSDRIYIESELNIGSTFKSIADTLGKDPSTISKEVRLHRMQQRLRKHMRQRNRPSVSKSVIHHNFLAITFIQ